MVIWNFFKRFLKSSFMIFIVLVSFMLVLGQFNIWISENFSKYGLSLFAYALPYLYALNLILFIILVIKRNWAALIPAFGLLFTLSAITKVYSFGNKQTNDNIDENLNIEHQKLKIITWNCGLFGINEYTKHPEVKDSMVQFLKSKKADIICMQEFVAADQPRSDVYNLLSEIVTQIGMPYFYYPYNPYYDIDDRHHYGNIILSRYPFVDTQVVKFDTSLYNNSFIFADINIKGKIFKVIDFHLQSLNLKRKDYQFTVKPELNSQKEVLDHSKNIYKSILFNYKRRVLQATAVSTLIESSEYPVIACGDMNDVPSSYAYYILKGNLCDAFLQGGKGIGKTFQGLIPTLRIDYTFYTCDALQVLSSSVNHINYSDHYPVITEFSY